MTYHCRRVLSAGKYIRQEQEKPKGILPLCSYCVCVEVTALSTYCGRGATSVGVSHWISPRGSIPVLDVWACGSVSSAVLTSSVNDWVVIGQQFDSPP